MADPVATLLERGLRHYALGEIERAVACWREALERDPDSARAREYLTLVRASVPTVVALPPATRPKTPGSKKGTPGPARRKAGKASGTPGPVRSAGAARGTAGPRSTPGPARATPPPPPPPDPVLPDPAALARDITHVEELSMPPDPAWVQPLDGQWADAIPRATGDGASSGTGRVPLPAPLPAEVEVHLDLTPGPGGFDGQTIEVSPGPGMSPPGSTPGPTEPSRVLVGTPVDDPAVHAAASAALVAARPGEHSNGPFGAPEAFDIGSGARRPASSGWEVGPDATPSVEVAIEGTDALGLVNGKERNRPVGAPVRTPEAPSPTSVADTLMCGARELFDLGDFSGSLELVQKALDADPEHREARNYLERNQGTLIQMYESKLGALQARPRVMLKPDEIVWLSLDHRAGFVLAQIDGTVTYDDIFSVSSLSRLDTAKILAELLEQGVIAA